MKKVKNLYHFMKENKNINGIRVENEINLNEKVKIIII